MAAVLARLSLWSAASFMAVPSASSSSIASSSSSTITTSTLSCAFSYQARDRRWLADRKPPNLFRFRAVLQDARQTEALPEADSSPPGYVVADHLVMLFKAEGTLVDSAIPKLVKALESCEGVGNVNVFISEGIATAELTKQTNIQATGVASGLVEVIQGAGFKLQNLSLGFDDLGDEDDDLFDYDPSSYEEEGVES